MTQVNDTRFAASAEAREEAEERAHLRAMSDVELAECHELARQCENAVDATAVAASAADIPFDVRRDEIVSSLIAVEVETLSACRELAKLTIEIDTDTCNSLLNIGDWLSESGYGLSGELNDDCLDAIIAASKAVDTLANDIFATSRHVRDAEHRGLRLRHLGLGP